MNIILGVGTLVLVLIVMTLFLNFAPYGKQGLQAFIRSCLCNFLTTSIPKLRYWWRIPYRVLQTIGDLAGSLAGVAVGILTGLKMGISPVLQ